MDLLNKSIKQSIQGKNTAKILGFDQILRVKYQSNFNCIIHCPSPLTMLSSGGVFLVNI